MTGRHLHARDLTLWVGLAGVVVLEHVLVAVSTRAMSNWWWLLISLAAVTVATVLRRRRAHLALLLALGLVGGRILWALPQEAPFPISYAAVLALFAWLAGRSGHQARRLTVLVVVADLLVLALGIPLRGEETLAFHVFNWLVMVFGSLVCVVLPWLLGRSRRQQVLLATAGWDRAARVEHEQQLLVERARLRERALIARDMHDSLGHELSLIALRAGALEVAPDIPEERRRAAGALRSAAGTATGRLAEIIGVLREDDTAAPLTPAGEGVAAVVARARASGMDVRLVTTGPPPDVPALAGATHRVIQEGLTNAAKHAPGAAVTVRVDHSHDATTVSVTNARPEGAPRHAVAGPGGGHGIWGLSERVGLLGGTVTATPGEGGGHELVASVPHRASRLPSDPAGVPPSPSTVERETARRSARRGLLVALLAPPAMGLALGLVILGYYVGISYAAVLAPADYEALEVGESRASVEAVLPPTEMVDAPTRRGPDAPEGASCEFYRPDGPFSITYVYRLCFADDALVAKDVIRSGSTPVDQENP